MLLLQLNCKKVKFTLLYPLVLLLQNIYAQVYTIRIEIKDEYSQEFILGAKINFTDESRIEVAKSGILEFTTNRRFHHLHVFGTFYEIKELDVDLAKETSIVVLLHPTSLEMRETVIEHALISNSERSSSVAISLINREEMLDRNPGSFAETLESIPGVTTNNVGVGIARPVIRGLAGTRIYVADMGLRQEGQQWGNDHGLELDQYGVERVELIRGPATIVYGPDAMAGVVHILSDIWPDENGIKGEVISGFKTNNETLFNSFGVKGLKNNFYFNFRMSQKTYSDMRVPIDSFNYLTFVLPIYERRLKNTAGREYNASLTLGYKTNNSKFWIRASHYDLHQGLFAGAIGVPNAYGLGHQNDFRNIELPSQRVGHFKLDAHQITRLKRSVIWSTDIGYQRNDRLEQSLAHLHGVVLSEPSDTAHHFVLQTLQFRSTLKKTISSSLKTNFGITGLYQENRHSGFEFLLPNFISSELGLYTLIEHKATEKLNLNYGARTDISQVQTEQKLRETFQQGQTHNEELAPALNRSFFNWAAQIGLNYEITHHHIVKVNLARTYRFPRAVELTMNGVHHGTFRHEIGNPNLNTETALQFDVLYEFHTNSSLLTLTPFVNYYNNFIYLRPTGQFSALPDAGQQFIYTQHDALLSGTEILYQKAYGRKLILSTKAQYVHAYNLTLGRSLPFIPPLEFSFEPEIKIDRFEKIHAFNLKPGVQYIFSQTFVDINEKQTPGTFLVNADLKFSLFQQKSIRKVKLPQGLIFNLALRNIFNTPYLKHLSRYRLLDITEPGFNFMFSVRVPLTAGL